MGGQDLDDAFVKDLDALRGEVRRILGRPLVPLVVSPREAFAAPRLVALRLRATRRRDHVPASGMELPVKIRPADRSRYPLFLERAEEAIRHVRTGRIEYLGA